MKKILIYSLLSLTSLLSYAQKPSMAIIEIKSTGLEEDNATVTDIVRFEVEKTQKYNLMEKEDMQVIFAREKHNPTDCYNQLCIVFTGKTLLVDKVLSGSVNKLGDNKLVVLKLYDMKTESVEISKKIEIISDDDESINSIIAECVNQFFTNKEKFITVNLKKEPEPEPEKKEEVKKEDQSYSTPAVRYYNGVPITGSYGKYQELQKEERYPKIAITTRPFTILEFYSKINLGVQYSLNDAIAVKASGSYILTSENNYEQSIWNYQEPGAKNGFDLRGEFMVRTASSYYTQETNYTRYYVSFEGGYLRRNYFDVYADEYDPNIGTLTYKVPDQYVTIVMGNAKCGVQNVISEKIYIDVYAGLGVRSHRYYDQFTLNSAGYRVRSQSYPNFVAGFELGYVIKNNKKIIKNQ